MQWKRSPDAKVAFTKVVENRSGIITLDRNGIVYGNGVYDGHFNVDLVNDVNGIVRAYALSLFHPAPRHVLMIGFSSGSWAQVVANHPQLESLTIVEINPGYRQLAAQNPEVASVLRNPKVTLVDDDGRRWLRSNPEQRFDVIVSNASYHFRANASNLLSTDFLAIVRAHLKVGGVAFYNTTGSSRVQRTGCTAFPFGARFTNQMVVSSSAIKWNFRRWRDILSQYQIDGRLVLDRALPKSGTTLDRMMLLESHLAHAGTLVDNDAIETCPEILDRTAGQATVTDDNMGTEWRHSFGFQ